MRLIAILPVYARGKVRTEVHNLSGGVKVVPCVRAHKKSQREMPTKELRAGPLFTEAFAPAFHSVAGGRLFSTP